jgi:signal transduction histidine kinase
MEKFKVVFETREEERMRIARDLHDDMGSTLSSIGIYTKVVSAYIDSDKEKANEYLDKIQDNARLLMENTTDLIWALQTNYGEMESIFRRMQRTAIEMLSSSNITPHIQIASPENLPLLHINAQKNCWLIFKEALNNVCKYSKAANCYISIKKELDRLVISITDDGVGFENPTQGNGLNNMRSRAMELQGEFIIESTLGQGTVSKAAFPMNRISMTVINPQE